MKQLLIFGDSIMPAGLYLSQMEETLKAAPEAFEAHRRYADLMFMAEGEETVFYTPAAELREITSAYDAESDCLLAAPQPGAVTKRCDSPRTAKSL